MDMPRRTYQIQRIIGHHFFGRKLLRQYANEMATDEVGVAFINDDWNSVQLGELNREMMGMWTDVIESMHQEGVEMIRIHISHQDLTMGDIKIPLQRIEDISPESIMERIAKVVQSNENLKVDGLTEMSVGINKLSKAQGRHQHLSVTNESLKLKRCLVVIENDDTLCLSSVQAWEAHQKKELTRWR